VIVPETKPASELLDRISRQAHLDAVVVDEFGSILGLVTMKILEQLVGKFTTSLMSLNARSTLADGAIVFDAALMRSRFGYAVQLNLPETPRTHRGVSCSTNLGSFPRRESFDTAISIQRDGNGRAPRRRESSSCARAYREGRSLFPPMRRAKSESNSPAAGS